MERLSYSRMQTFLKCRHQYYLKYVLGLNPKPKTMYFDVWERFTRGSLIHAGMEGGFLGTGVARGIDEWIVDNRKRPGFTDEQEANLPTMRTNAIAVADQALAWLPVSEWEPLEHNGKPMVEAELLVPIPGWDGVVMFLDLVARERSTGRVFVVDWKTRERFEGDDDDTYATQFVMYQYGLRHFNIPCDGSMIVEMKPKPPARATTEQFRKKRTLHSDEYITNVWNEVLAVSQQMLAYEGQCTRNISAFNCKGCFYERICQAELRGYDTEDIIQDGYVKKSSSTTPKIITVVE